MEKVKNVFGMGAEEHRTTEGARATTGAAGAHTSAGPGAGYAEGQQFTTTTTQPAAHRAGAEGAHERAPHGGVAHWEAEGRRGEQRVGEGEVCRQEFYTRVEDRPVVKERVERLIEHHPVVSVV